MYITKLTYEVLHVAVCWGLLTLADLCINVDVHSQSGQLLFGVQPQSVEVKGTTTLRITTLDSRFLGLYFPQLYTVYTTRDVDIACTQGETKA